MEFNLIRFIFIDHQTNENSNSIYSFYSMFQFLDLIRDFSILSIYKKSRRKENNQNTTWKKNEGWFQDFKLQKFCEMLFWKVNYYNPKLCREKLVLLYSYVIVNLYPRCYRYKRFFSSFYYRNYNIQSNAFLSWFDEIYDIKSLRMLFPAHKKQNL